MKIPLSTEVALSFCLKLKKIFSSPQPHIFISAMPKSASTFLHHSLLELTGFKSAYFASEYRNIEQELYRPSLIDVYDVATVTQQHVRANLPNLLLIEQFNLRPVVLVRDVYDVVVSMRDHLLNERLDNLPSIYAPEAYPELDGQQQLDLLVDYAAPWLISFYHSWVAAEAAGSADILWLRYSEASSDWPATLRRVIDFHEIKKSDDEITQALDNLQLKRKSRLRMNKGIAGRGARELTVDQRQRIDNMTHAYPKTDFSIIGIGRAY